MLPAPSTITSIMSKPIHPPSVFIYLPSCMLPAPSMITSSMSTAIHLLLSSICLLISYLHQAQLPVSCLQPYTFFYHLSSFMYATCNKHDHLYVTCTKHDHHYHVYSHPPSAIIYLHSFMLPAPSTITSIMSTAIRLPLSSICLHACYLHQAPEGGWMAVDMILVIVLGAGSIHEGR